MQPQLVVSQISSPGFLLGRQYTFVKIVLPIGRSARQPSHLAMADSLPKVHIGRDISINNTYASK